MTLAHLGIAIVVIGAMGAGVWRTETVRLMTIGDVISVGPDDTILTTYARMRMYDVSQLPVLDGNGGIAGIVDEEDVLFGTCGDAAKLKQPVSTVMATTIITGKNAAMAASTIATVRITNTAVTWMSMKTAAMEGAYTNPVTGIYPKKRGFF